MESTGKPHDALKEHGTDFRRDFARLKRDFVLVLAMLLLWEALFIVMAVKLL
jgi:hypothetical protein